MEYVGDKAKAGTHHHERRGNDTSIVLDHRDTVSCSAGPMWVSDISRNMHDIHHKMSEGISCVTESPEVSKLHMSERWVEVRVRLRKAEQNKAYQFRDLRSLVSHIIKSGQWRRHQCKAGHDVDPSSAEAKFIIFNACSKSRSLPSLSNWIALECGYEGGSTVISHYSECDEMHDDAGVTDDAYICALEEPCLDKTQGQLRKTSCELEEDLFQPKEIRSASGIIPACNVLDVPVSAWQTCEEFPVSLPHAFRSRSGFTL